MLVNVWITPCGTFLCTQFRLLYSLYQNLFSNLSSHAPYFVLHPAGPPKTQRRKEEVVDECIFSG